MFLRLVAAAALCAGLTACARNDLNEQPVPFKDFGLGLNIAVADKVEMVPISRPADPKDWEAAIQKAVNDRFGETRYQGTRLYNIGIAVEAYALAPPGIPVLAAPKSVLVVTANIWDDAAQKKLNEEGFQITVFESLSGETLIGTGLTRTKDQQMAALSYNVAVKVEQWLKDHPEWFGMTKAELDAAIKAQGATPAAGAKTAPAPSQPVGPAQPATPAKAAPQAPAKAAAQPENPPRTAAPAPTAAPAAPAQKPAAAPAKAPAVAPAAAAPAAPQPMPQPAPVLPEKKKGASSFSPKPVTP